MFEMRAKIVAMGLIGGAILLPINAAQAEQVGHASWYALHSRTASGEIMNPGDLTAAHRSLPFGTRVLVENLSNGHSVVVRINDRGPFVAGRIIDVSKAAASSLGMLGSGTRKSESERGWRRVSKQGSAQDRRPDAVGASGEAGGGAGKYPQDRGRGLARASQGAAAVAWSSPRPTAPIACSAGAPRAS